MATITNFVCVDESGTEIPCDAFGNNVALSCPNCGHPILAIVRENQRGSHAKNPAVCRRCRLEVCVTVDSELRLVQMRFAIFV